MCGIVGLITNQSNVINESLLTRMAYQLKHRGPDDEGYAILNDSNGSKTNVGLAHRRLSIIDLSERARQPMYNETKTVYLVCNGEIYNFIELRKELEEKGHQFRSKSDSEVILHLYEEKGDDFVHYLDGMFALALWDSRKKVLILARDHVGKKPLYYFFKDGHFAFASEIKSLLELPFIHREPDLLAIHHYLTLQYVPNPLTAFKDIYKLEPATMLIFRDGRIEKKRYWDIDFSKKVALSENDIIAVLDDKLKKAVKKRLISDVPLGCFLSGGLDSSAIVALTSEVQDKPVKTFSIGFHEEEYNELPYAKKIADLYNTEHYELMVTPSAEEILDEIVWLYNEPFADPSAIPTYYLSKMAKEEVTVVLSGDGGDENFGGYDRYIMQLNRFNYSNRRFPSFMYKKPFLTLANFLYLPFRTLNKNYASFANRYNAFKAQLNAQDEAFYYHETIAQFPEYMKAQLLSSDYPEHIRKESSPEWLAKDYRQITDQVEASLYTDMMNYLPDDILVKVDVASMAHALEVRSPFLDKDLMEFVASLPGHLKINNGTQKYILKKYMEKKIPEEIIDRPKMGFGVPLDHWFRGKLQSILKDHILGDRFAKRRLFNMDYVKKMYEEHTSGRTNWMYQLWNLFMLEKWFRRFID